MSKERQVTSLFYVTIMVPHLEITQSMQMRVLVLSFQYLTQKEPLACVSPLFYMTWVMMQVLTSWKACMCSMPSLMIVAEMGVCMCCNQAVPRPLGILFSLATCSYAEPTRYCNVLMTIKSSVFCTTWHSPRHFNASLQPDLQSLFTLTDLLQVASFWGHYWYWC